VDSSQVPAEAAIALDRWLGGGTWIASPVAGDASTRRYFRVISSRGASSILTFYPPDVREALGRFLDANEALRRHVNVPRVLEHDEAVVLQEDVGDESLSHLLAEDRDAAVIRYEEAAALLERLAGAADEAAGINPPFDRRKFIEELDMTRQYFVEELAHADSEVLTTLFSELAERLTEHPYTLCHRDYHGQNIYIYNNALYVIDYQDMRSGPDTYDLASLLRDRGVWRRLGSELEVRLVEAHAGAKGESYAAVRKRYCETLLQRSIKAVGTFARQVVVYGRRQYLVYIDPTLETIRECAGELEEWRDLHSLFPFDHQSP